MLPAMVPRSGLLQMLESAALRPTAQRLAVLDALCALHTPGGVPALEVMRELVSRRSVVTVQACYRVLHRLAESGLLCRRVEERNGRGVFLYAIAAPQGQDACAERACRHCGGPRASGAAPLPLWTSVRPVTDPPQRNGTTC